jgi:murein L,D-transpeptidase YcbB/YkuD
MKGLDVTELINILLKKKYLVLGDPTQTTVSGEYTFDDVVENAVKEFQTHSSLEASGIVDNTTIYYLKNK